jgi:hypothetical protein
MVSGTVYSVSAPATWMSPAGDKEATCLGWKLYKYNVNGTWDLWREGNGNTIADYEHPGVFTRIEWLWTESFKCTAVASGQGSVDKTSEWHARGDTFTVSATPSNGWVFACWTGSVPKSKVVDNPLVLEVSDSINVTSVFVVAGSVAYWTGAGTNALASNPANWRDGEQPFHMQTIAFGAEGADKPMTWDLDIAPGGWVQTNYNSVVTFNTVYPDAGLGDFTILLINGDVNLQSGSWTHLVNKTGQFYRLNVRVGGDMAIGPAAAIDVAALGYSQLCLDGGVAKTSANEGGSYGARAGVNGTRAVDPYGCYYAPEEPGSGGTGGQDGRGGGAVKLTVAGTLTHNGVINANGSRNNWGHYIPSGGSIWIIAGAIEGTGTLLSRSQNQNYSGSGGRIAVILTGKGADFSAYDLVHLANASTMQADAPYSGGPGTIYAETAADTPQEGWLILKGNGVMPDSAWRYGNPFTKDYTSLHFARITLTNTVYLTVEPGRTLDLRGTEVVAAPSSQVNGIYMAGGDLVLDPVDQPISSYLKIANGYELDTAKLTIGANGNLWYLTTPAPFGGDIEVAAGGTLTIAKTLTVDGSMAVNAGGLIQTTGPYAAPSIALDLHVKGDMSIAEGGTVSATGSGYSGGNGPAPGGVNCGASHGGWGRDGAGTCTLEPYGSIYNPVTHGAATGGSGAGGGVILLVVEGMLTNNGSIESCGTTGSYHYGGAGGSVNITAGSLAGAATGVIKADAHPVHCSACEKGPSGGGRIAVTLTDAAADFAPYLGKITAFGARINTTTRSGGAGTIYLRTAAQQLDEGTLIIDNDNGFDPAGTPVGGAVEGTAFGTVEIRNKGKLVAAPDANITVSTGWHNWSGIFESGADSGVQFSGPDAFTFGGTNTFANLGCTVGGKSITVANDSRIVISDNLSLSGTAHSPLALAPATPDGTWTLDTSAGLASIADVALRGCQSVAEVTDVNGTDNGNNVNVIFTTVAAGETVIWTGAAGTAWNDPDNWNPARVPIRSDNVVIPGNTPNYPILSVGVSCASVTVNTGASLTIGNKLLVVDGNFTMHGAMIASGNGEVMVGGNVSFHGTFETGTSTFRLNGAAAQNFQTTSATLYNLVVETPSATFAGDLSCAGFSVGDGATAHDVAFANGMTLKANSFTIAGDTSLQNVTLRPATAGGTWLLNVNNPSVSGATVSGSDASLGVAIVPADSTDAGGNVNWFFTDNRPRWLGTAGTAFNEPTNWSSGTVPGAADSIVIASANPLVISTATTIGALTVSSGGNVTVDDSLTVNGSVVVEDGGLLVWNKRGTIGGSLVLLDGAEMTHTVNTGSTEQYKIDLVIGGDGYIAAGARINCCGKGLTANGLGGGVLAGRDAGGSHGGRGYASHAAMPCYGSLMNPTNIGSRGTWGAYGGGAVVLNFAGDFVFDGEITVEGGAATGYYTGSGGSIFIKCATFSGTGCLNANGSTSSENSLYGGGGRIAVHTTSATSLDAFTGTMTAWGGCTGGVTVNGSAGTIYTETAAVRPGHGTVRMSNKPGYTSRNNTFDMTDFPSTNMGEPASALKNVTLVVEHYASLNITGDCTVSDLQLGSGTRLLLNGYTLTVRTREHPLSGSVQTGDGGQIVWLPRELPTLLLVR